MIHFVDLNHWWHLRFEWIDYDHLLKLWLVLTYFSHPVWECMESLFLRWSILELFGLSDRWHKNYFWLGYFWACQRLHICNLLMGQGSTGYLKLKNIEKLKKELELRTVNVSLVMDFLTCLTGLIHTSVLPSNWNPGKI